MASLITLSGVDQAISDLNYRNANAVKSKLVHLIRQYYSDERSVDRLRVINTDDLVKALWQTGNQPEVIRNRRKNYNSIKSSVNSELARLYEAGKNPEGILIGDNNIFVMSDEAKEKALRALSSDMNGDGAPSLSQMLNLLKNISGTLSDLITAIGKGTANDLEVVDQLKNLIQGLSQKIASSVSAPDSEKSKKIDTESEMTIAESETDPEKIEKAQDSDEAELLEDIAAEAPDENVETSKDSPQAAKGSDGEAQGPIGDDEGGALPGVKARGEMAEAGGDDGDQEHRDGQADSPGEAQGETGSRAETGFGEKAGLDGEISSEDMEVEDDLEEAEKIEADEDLETEEDIEPEEDLEADEDVEADDDIETEEDPEEIEAEADVEEIEETEPEADLEEIEEAQDLDEDEGLEDIAAGEPDETVETSADSPQAAKESDGDGQIQIGGDKGGALIGIGTTKGERVDGRGSEYTGDDGGQEHRDGQADLPGEAQGEAGSRTGAGFGEKEGLGGELAADDLAEAEEIEADEDIEAEEEVEPEEDLEAVEDVESEADLEEIEEAEPDEDLEGEDDLEETEEIEADEDLEPDEDPEEIEAEADLEEIEDADELLEDIDETDPEPVGGAEEFGLPVDSLGLEIAPEVVAQIKEARLLAEKFHESLGEMDRYFNHYLYVAGGDYIIGRPRPKKDQRHEQTVRLSPFYFARFPVTNALFEIFMEKTGYQTTAEKAGFGTVYYGRFRNTKDESTGLATSTWNSSLTYKTVKGACWYQPSGPGSSLHHKRNHPVVQISHEDAMAFAAWTGKRLPTEDEWEAAARTQNALMFPWGNNWQKDACNTEESCHGETTPVDQYIEFANGMEVADVLGNVLEWIRDDLRALSNNDNSPPDYFAKGGSWTSAENIRLCDRFKLDREAHSNILGFRCVAD